LRDANKNNFEIKTGRRTKWAQRANVKHVQEGGNSAKYFHLIANGKHRKKNSSWSKTMGQ
jgi:hypothetical protein